MKLTVIVPVFNERASLPALRERLAQAVTAVTTDYELLFVDDGSTDGSGEVLRGWRASDARVTLLSFTRNFGHQTALTAGLDHATGDAVITMDADLQHPPEIIAALVNAWRGGALIVHTVRDDEGSAGLLKRATSRLFYKLFAFLAGIDLGLNAADLRLLDKRVVASLRTMREHHRFLRGLIAWTGFSSTAIPYRAGPRTGGESRYTMRKMVSLALNGITSFSIVPLYVAVALGTALTAAAFFYGLYIAYARFVTHHVVAGWTSLVTAMLLIGGVQLVILGVVGLYVGKIFEEVKRRPLYVLDDRPSA